MDKVDKILQEIYLEMEIEEVQEGFELISLQLEGETLTEGTKEDLMAQFNTLKAKLPGLMDKAKSATGPAKKEIMTQIKNLQGQMGDIRGKIAKFASGAVKQGGEALEKGRQMAAGAGEEISKRAGEAGKAVSKVAGQAGEKVSQAAGAAKDLAAANPAAAAAVGAIAAVAAGVAIYKKFFSQAARACKGKSGPDKKNCVNSFKAKGLQAAKAKVLSGMSKCKDPKCKAKLQAKAQGFDSKIKALKGSMAEDLMMSYVGDYIHEFKGLLEQDSKN